MPIGGRARGLIPTAQMTCFLTISVGESADDARPLVASTDLAIVRAAILAILGAVDHCEPPPFPERSIYRGESRQIALAFVQAETSSLCVVPPTLEEVELERERAGLLEDAARAEATSALGDGLRALAAWHLERANELETFIQESSEDSPFEASRS